MRGKSVVLAALLFSTTAFAQGTFLYTWHGDSGLFQGNFQVTAEENQPGQHFESQTFYNSILFTSPDDAFTYTYFFGPGLHDEADGMAGPNFSLSFILFDTLSARELTAFANANAAVVHEFNLQDGSQLWADGGYWTSIYVPEPSASALLAFATVLWTLNKRRGSRLE